MAPRPTKIMTKNRKAVFAINGVRVKDALNEIPVRITKNDVKLGATKNSNSCAAVRALCRETGCEAAKVHLSRTYVKQNGTWLRYVTPAALRQEIVAFDRGGTFAPGEYTLVPVQPTVRLGAPRKPSSERVPKTKVPQRGNKQKNHVVSSVRKSMSVVGE